MSGRFALLLMMITCCAYHLQAQDAIMQKFYIATLATPGGDVPFQMSVALRTHADDHFVPVRYTIINGDENISGSIDMKGDSLVFNIPVFNAEIIAYTTGKALEMQGRFYDYSRPGNYYLPFRAIQLADNEPYFRFVKEPLPPVANISGRYDAVFYDNGTPDSTVGVFEQFRNHLEGTFLTTTGDYRFLEGEVSGNQFYLSAFDGSHVFMFKGTIHSDDSLSGNFYSGKHYSNTFTAVKNPEATLPDAATLTWLKPGYDKIAFSFPDINGDTVALDDAQFQNKVVIITITGTWCPNCMDETSYLSELEDRYANRGLEIIALSFERQTDPVLFKTNIEKVKNHFGTDFTYLNAGLPKTASDALPMLNKVMGFPTMIVLDRNHKVVEIHTGFSGPATGRLFQEFSHAFEAQLELLLSK